MFVLRADNVNGALAAAVRTIKHQQVDFIRCPSRGGRETMEFHCPVATVYTRSWRRVLLNPVRDANPFFHLMEAIWMMAGRSDAAFLNIFSSKIGQYAEDNGNFYGAYGHRWFNHFHRDQIDEVIAMLSADPSSRRAVIAMWDPHADLSTNARDLPCNTHIYFKVRNERLNMTVCNRSNDIILGCYGANAVHFSVLHEAIAHALGVHIGIYTQVSDSWHYYTDDPYVVRVLSSSDPNDVGGYEDYYRQGHADARISSMAMFNEPLYEWIQEAARFIDNDDWRDRTQYTDVFFYRVAVPMRDAWDNYKRGDLETARALCSMIGAPDWKRACHEWIQRRIDKRSAA